MFRESARTMAYYSQNPRKKRPPKRPFSYTERQQMIMNGEYVDHLRRNEITMLMEKALDHGDDDIARNVADMYDDFMNPKDERTYTKEEAVSILDRLDEEFKRKNSICE